MSNQNVWWQAGSPLKPMATALIAMICLVSIANGQQPVDDSTIAYRLVGGKTMHFDDAQKASDHLQAVKKLGCEVDESQHAGHGDVSYRCTKWKALTVADDKLAHQWEAWLKAAGFETLHGHLESKSHEESEGHDHEHAHEEGEHEELTYRLTRSVTLHPQAVDEAQELIAILKGLGCDVQESRHETRLDISLHCPQWMHLAVETHEAAESWQKWLAKIGFEVQHED